MCQNACLPAPKTVIVCTSFRFCSIKVAPRADRKAVSSIALRIPRGVPHASIIVTVPLGVVLCELDTDDGGRKDAPEIDEPLVESSVAVGVNFIASIPLDTELLLDSWLTILELLDVNSSGSTVTTFIPTDVPVDAGMKTVVACFFLIATRAGW